jgi:hypothetical protein
MAESRPNRPAPRPAAKPAVKPASSKNKMQAGTLFTKDNHKWMMIGGALIVLGYIAMAGGRSIDPTQFKAADVYSPLRITVAPLLVLAGFGTLIWAILKKPATSNTTTP